MRLEFHEYQWMKENRTFYNILRMLAAPWFETLKKQSVMDWVINCVTATDRMHRKCFCHFLSLNDSTRIWTQNFKIMGWVFYHWATIAGCKYTFDFIMQIRCLYWALKLPNASTNTMKRGLIFKFDVFKVFTMHIQSCFKMSKH